MSFKSFKSNHLAVYRAKIIMQTKKKYKSKIETYVAIVEKQPLEKRDRNKIVSLIIIDEHNREIISKLIDQNISSQYHFEWQ